MNDDNFDCLQAQCEEIEALKAIYSDDWKTEPGPSGSFSIDIREGNYFTTLYLTLPMAYPKESPPEYTISAPTLSTQQKNQLSVYLDDVYLNNIGECVLYQWIERIREFLVDVSSKSHPAQTDNSRENKTLSSALAEEDDQDLAESLQRIELESYENKKSNNFPALKEQRKIGIQFETEIIHGEIITDRKSTFQGHVARVFSVEEVKHVLSILLENKKVAHATHNMFAYRIELLNSALIQDCDDDGETQAGSRMLHLLQILNVKNAVVMVSRWYGGIQLGPDRFRHINNATRKVLEQAGFLTQQ